MIDITPAVCTMARGRDLRVVPNQVEEPHRMGGQDRMGAPVPAREPRQEAALKLAVSAVTEGIESRLEPTDDAVGAALCERKLLDNSVISTSGREQF